MVVDTNELNMLGEESNGFLYLNPLTGNFYKTIAPITFLKTCRGDIPTNLVKKGSYSSFGINPCKQNISFTYHSVYDPFKQFNIDCFMDRSQQSLPISITIKFTRVNNRYSMELLCKKGSVSVNHINMTNINPEYIGVPIYTDDIYFIDSYRYQCFLHKSIELVDIISAIIYNYYSISIYEENYDEDVFHSRSAENDIRFDFHRVYPKYSNIITKTPTSKFVKTGRSIDLSKQDKSDFTCLLDDECGFENDPEWNLDLDKTDEDFDLDPYFGAHWYRDIAGTSIGYVSTSDDFLMDIQSKISNNREYIPSRVKKV